MNPADPLAQLRDIHLPEAVSWWPPAPGWWVVSLIALAAVVTGILYTKKRYLQNRYRKAALRELENIFKNGKDQQQAQLEEMSILLRRTAIQAYGRENIAPLFGDKWLDFLDNSGKTDQFSNGPAKVLGYGLYQTTAEADLNQVMRIIQSWIKEHRI